MKQPATGNIFDRLPDATENELSQTLAEGTGFRVERIVSRGQASKDGFWYDQPQDEWVVVLEGRARIELEKPRRTLDLERGDWLHLPARCRHRVAWTDPEQDTFWLAVHGLP